MKMPIFRLAGSLLISFICICLIFVLPAAAAEDESDASEVTIVTSRAEDSDDADEADDTADDDDAANDTAGNDNADAGDTADDADASDDADDAAASDDAAVSDNTDTSIEYTPLTPGMKGDDVLKMQNALKNLGFPGFIADGDYGENTETAVKLFQFYNDLPATGEADEDTLAVLYGSGAEKYKLLSKGATGNVVKYVQQFLYDAGFLTEDPDGSFGPGTEGAIRVYQAAAGLETQDGSAGKDTILAMIGDPIIFESLEMNDTGELVTALQNKLKELGFLKEEPSGWFGEETETAVKEFQMYAGLEITGEADADTCSAIFRKTASFKELARGAKGTSVQMLQTLLKDLGYLSDEPDGSFGNQTKQAVRDFQVVNGLSRDGSFGKKTADMLFDDPLPYDQEVLDNAGNDAEAFAKEVLDEIGWDLYAAFEWAVGLRYGSQNTAYNTTDAAIYSFINRSGNCLGMATTFYWMAKALGYEAYAIQGKVPYRDADFGEHAWVEVVIDGTTYVCDPDFEWQEKRNGYMLRYGQSGTWQYQYGYVMSD